LTVVGKFMCQNMFLDCNVCKCCPVYLNSNIDQTNGKFVSKGYIYIYIYIYHGMEHFSIPILSQDFHIIFKSCRESKMQVERLGS
jgi:hypothetical protein